MQLTKVALGATRRILTSKYGNKNYYKGRGVRNPGFNTKFGAYRIVKKKVGEIIVPDLTGFQMTPYVAYATKKSPEEKMTPEKLVDEVRTNMMFIKNREVP